jgi:hypothetical protein
MKQYEDGTVLVQAAEDYGGFKRVQSAPVGTSSVYRPRSRFSDIPINWTMYDPRDPRDPHPQDPRGIQSMNDDGVAQIQRKIHAEIAIMRQKKPMSFASAWEKLQSSKPEMFRGLEPRIVHPD